MSSSSMLLPYVVSFVVGIAAAAFIWLKLTPHDERRTLRFLFLAALPVPAVIQIGSIPFHYQIYNDNAALGSYTSIFGSEVSVIQATYFVVLAAAFVLPLWPFIAKRVAWPTRGREILRAAFLSSAGIQVGGMAATLIWVFVIQDSSNSPPDQPLNLAIALSTVFSSTGELISSAGELAIFMWLGIRARRWVVAFVVGFSLSLFGSTAIWMLPRSILPDFVPPFDLTIIVYTLQAMTFVAVLISVAILSWIFVQSDDDPDVGKAADEHDTTLPDTVSSTP